MVPDSVKIRLDKLRVSIPGENRKSSFSDVILKLLDGIDTRQEPRISIDTKKSKKSRTQRIDTEGLDSLEAAVALVEKRKTQK